MRFFFHKLDAPLYAALVVKLSSSKNEKSYEFLKLVLEGTRFIKQNTRKGFENAKRIEKYFRQ